MFKFSHIDSKTQTTHAVSLFLRPKWYIFNGWWTDQFCWPRGCYRRRHHHHESRKGHHQPGVEFCQNTSCFGRILSQTHANCGRIPTEDRNYRLAINFGTLPGRARGFSWKFLGYCLFIKCLLLWFSHTVPTRLSKGLKKSNWAIESRFVCVVVLFRLLRSNMIPIMLKRDLEILKSRWRPKWQWRQIVKMVFSIKRQSTTQIWLKWNQTKNQTVRILS